MTISKPSQAFSRLLLLGVALSAAAAAPAQVSGDHFLGYPRRDDVLTQFARFNQADCTGDNDVQFYWRFTDVPEPSYTYTVLLFQNNGAPNDVCPTWQQRLGREYEELVVDAPFDRTSVSLTDLQLTFEDVELMGSDACTAPYIRDQTRTMCLYILDLNGFSEAYVSEGFPVDVDTALPNAPVISSLVAADSRVTVTVPEVDAPDGDAHTVYIGQRECAETDAGVDDVIDSGPEDTEEQEEGRELRDQ